MRAIFISLVLGIAAAGAAEFDSVFSSGMVVQREVPLRLSGKGVPGAEVIVSVDGVEMSARVSNEGVWTSEFPAMKTGGPHVLKAVENGAAVLLEDVLCGDVWVCSGQSNMQMGIREVIGGKEALAAAATFPEVRILTVPRGGADQPKTQIDAKWERRAAESSGDFSAVAWFFANHLKQDASLANVPLGIINSSFGGTSIEAWTPPGKLPELPKDQLSGSMFGIAPGALFNGMISPLTGLPIKGVLWYQGEANAGQPTVYQKLLNNLMHQWRDAWQQPELPFLIVELPAFDGLMGGYDFSWLRESQAKACAETTHAWLAVAHDTTDGRDLHPIEKEEIGRRLALLARRNVYQSEVIASGPVMRELKSEDGKLRLIFETSDGLTTRDGQAPVGFDIASEGGDYRRASATLEGTSVVLENPHISAPRTVRYAWGATPSSNLVNNSGLPVIPFRTDTLSPDRIFQQALPITHRLQTPLYQLTTGDNGQVASLIAGGRQFLSNEPNGGTRIPDGWGQRNFHQVEQLGPHRLRLFDATGSLEVFAREDALEWILRNDRDQEIEFRIALSAKVTVDFKEGRAELSRGETRLRIDGIDQVSSGEVAELVVKMAAHSTATLHVQVLP